MIFNIQRYSTHDGPGIRTVVFLKGCSTGCRWCQNPESRARTQDLLYDARLCLDGCDLCAQAAPAVIERALSGLLIYREKLTDDAFAALTDCCPTRALTVCGEVKAWMTSWRPYCVINRFTIVAVAGSPSRAANRLCSQNWRQNYSKPATTRAFIRRSKPVCMCRGSISSRHYLTLICSRRFKTCRRRAV